mmetsp:Transcript_32175/g.95712  ORF Transcript_32175/g.95712 Transcript_32175/m.95712 type:complete len:243 (+) Transcript_32175:100-828(+)
MGVALPAAQRDAQRVDRTTARGGVCGLGGRDAARPRGRPAPRPLHRRRRLGVRERAAAALLGPRALVALHLRHRLHRLVVMRLHLHLARYTDHGVRLRPLRFLLLDAAAGPLLRLDPRPALHLARRGARVGRLVARAAEHGLPPLLRLLERGALHLRALAPVRPRTCPCGRAVPVHLVLVRLDGHLCARPPRQGIWLARTGAAARSVGGPSLYEPPAVALPRQSRLCARHLSCLGRLLELAT